MAKNKSGLSVTVGAVDTKDMNEALRQMSAGMLKMTVSSKTSYGATASAFTGLRAILSSPPFSHDDAWKFGTVHRNKISDERVMVVGYRRVTGLSDAARRHDWRNVGATFDDWFDYWEVEP